MSKEEANVDLGGQCEVATASAATDNRQKSCLKGIWAQLVTCLRPVPDSDVADHGVKGRADVRDVKKSVWSYRPYDVF